jgi:hypothetical protein
MPTVPDPFFVVWARCPDADDGGATVSAPIVINRATRRPRFTGDALVQATDWVMVAV